MRAGRSRGRQTRFGRAMVRASAWKWGLGNGEWADFSGADARGKDLTHGHFFNANFSNADLQGANLDGTKLEGAILSHTSVMDLGQRSDGEQFCAQIKSDGIWILRGDFYEPIAQAKNLLSQGALASESAAILTHALRLSALKFPKIT